MRFDDDEGGMEQIDPVEHLKDLNLRQKATLAMAVANQARYDELRAEYRKELDALDAKYKQLEAPIFQDRCKIIAGEQGLDELKIEQEKLDEMKDQEALLPNFWFHTLRNCDTIRTLTGLSDDDKECMSYIRDVVCETLPLVEEEVEVEEDKCCCGDEKCECKEEKKEEEKKDEEKKEETKEGEEKKEKRKVKVQKRGFKVIFYFKEGNPYFPERELSKTFHLVQHPMELEPDFDGIDVVKPTWNAGKNLTVKTVTKTVKSKPKGKGKGKKPVTKKVTEEVPCESFFNFFNALEVPEDPSTLEEEDAAELEQAVQMDLEIGQVLCEEVIPRAILWYTGTACGDEDMDDFDDEDDDDDEGDDDEDGDDDGDDDDEDEDEDDDDNDDDAGESAPSAKQETPEECKQQ